MGDKLSGKRVLISGGGTGIGREIAHTFLDEGARVVICGRRHGPLKKTVLCFPELLMYWSEHLPNV